jgi:hypothetical protein
LTGDDRRHDFVLEWTHGKQPQGGATHEVRDRAIGRRAGCRS